MTPELFEEIFEKVKNEPKLVDTLKSLIVFLAVSGELLPGLNSKIFETLKVKDVLHRHVGGGTPSKSNPTYWGGNIRWASVKDVNKGKFLDSTIDSITESGLENSSSNLIPENHLIVVTRMGLGKVNINRVPVAINQDLRAFEFNEKIALDFGYLYFKSLLLEGTGTTVKGVKIKDILELDITVPPLEEQKRIVAKVDELMALCDELEESQKKSADIQKDFVASSLTKLQTKSSKIFKDFLKSNFDYFSGKPDLLQLSRNELVSLVVQGKFRKQGSTQPSFIPLGDLCSKTGSGSTPRGGKSVYQKSGIAILRSQNIYNDGLRLNDVAFINEETHEKMKGTKVYPGDLLLNITGGSIGRCCMVPPDAPEMNVSQHVSIIRSKDKNLGPFLHTVIRSPYFQSHIMNKQTGAGREGLPKKEMDKIPVPIFSPSDQQEITEQAKKIVALFDQLQANIKKEETIKADLLKTLVA